MTQIVGFHSPQAGRLDSPSLHAFAHSPFSSFSSARFRLNALGASTAGWFRYSRCTSISVPCSKKKVFVFPAMPSHSHFNLQLPDTSHKKKAYGDAHARSATLSRDLAGCYCGAADIRTWQLQPPPLLCDITLYHTSKVASDIGH